MFQYKYCVASVDTTGGTPPTLRSMPFKKVVMGFTKSITGTIPMFSGMTPKRKL